MREIRRLRECQTLDPGRGSFMVHPLSVKSSSGKFKKVNIGGISHPVFRAGNHVKHDARGNLVGVPHPEAFDFVVVYDEDLLDV